MANRPELTLDPQNWDDIRKIGHTMVDDMIDLMRDVRQQPVWKPMPGDQEHSFDELLPHRPQSLESVYRIFKDNILPYGTGNTHPRFWGWVLGSGTHVSMFAEMLASAMNPNVGLGNQSSVRVEKQVLDWCKQMFNYPKTASGLLVSGASMANLNALLVARNHKTGGSVRRFGTLAQGKQMVLYCSTETHACIQKAAEVMGLGATAVCKIPVDRNFRIRTDLLEKSIRADIAGGRLPFCIVGNAGTVNTGAIDPMDELLAISRKFDLWFHVDGAFGALAKNVPEYAHELKALEEADSIAFDFHKWMHISYEAGCVLIRNADAHRLTFEQSPNYLLQHERGISPDIHSSGNYGIELSRGFKALKIWMSLKTHGIFAYSALIRQNIAQATQLAEQISRHPNLELMAPRGLNIVCFRYIDKMRPPSELQYINREILMRLQEKGIAVVSSTIVNGCYALRASICNHRSKKEDFDLLLEHTVQIGDELSARENDSRFAFAR